MANSPVSALGRPLRWGPLPATLDACLSVMCFRLACLKLHPRYPPSSCSKHTLPSDQAVLHRSQLGDMGGSWFLPYALNPVTQES